jgi:hypothetical protein
MAISGTAGAWRRLAAYIGIGIAILVGAFLVMLPFWPYAHPDPIGSIIHTLTQISKYPWNGTVIFNGEVYAATELPWYYMPQMLLITTPEYIVLLGAAAILFALISAFKKLPTEHAQYFTPARLMRLGVAIAFVLPVAVVAIKQATLYDGIRHFLFVLGPWAIVAALALNKSLQYFEKAAASRPSLVLHLAPISIISLVACGAALTTEQYKELHPYQYTYFNSFVGGLPSAWQRFDTEYWGTSHREAVELLAKYLEEKGDNHPYKVSSPMAPWLVEHFLPGNLSYTLNGNEADFFISFLRFNAHLASDGQIMDELTVSRQGVPLAIIRDRRKIIEAREKAQKHRKAAPATISGILPWLQLF